LLALEKLASWTALRNQGDDDKAMCV